MAPLDQRQPLDVLTRHVANDTGIVDENVKAAEMPRSGGDERLPSGFAANVDRFGERLATRLDRHSLSRGEIDIGNHRPRSFAAEALDGRGADTRTPAGDDRALPCRRDTACTMRPACRRRPRGQRR